MLPSRWLTVYLLYADLFWLPFNLQQVWLGSVTDVAMEELLQRHNLTHVTLENVCVTAGQKSITMQIPAHSELKRLEICRVKPRGSQIVLNVPPSTHAEGQLRVSGCTVVLCVE